MEKKIILKMQTNKDITISCNGENDIIIPYYDRTIKADEIYELLNFSRGDTYVVVAENEQELDVPVLQFFEQLFLDIVKKINRIPKSDGDKYMTELNSIESKNV